LEDRLMGRMKVLGIIESWITISLSIYYRKYT
jgi:hypothetical protein